MKNIYTFASFSSGESLGFRLGGPGLGNLLFPWARSVAFSHRYGLPRINSTWKTVKLGPLLRGEFDKRLYNDLFKEQEVGEARKFFLLNYARKIREDEAEDFVKKASNSKKTSVIVFKGMEGLFEKILDDHAVVKEELHKMVLPHHMAAAKKFSANGISVHIRMGDFSIPNNEEVLRKGEWNYRLPLRWYANVIESLRMAIGTDVPVCVFSDGTDDELAEIMHLPNVRRVF